MPNRKNKIQFLERRKDKMWQRRVCSLAKSSILGDPNFLGRVTCQILSKNGFQSSEDETEISNEERFITKVWLFEGTDLMARYFSFTSGAGMHKFDFPKCILCKANSQKMSTQLNCNA